VRDFNAAANAAAAAAAAAAAIVRHYGIFNGALEYDTWRILKRNLIYPNDLLHLY